MSFICFLEDIPDNKALSFKISLKNFDPGIIIVRRGNNAHAFVNNCPHANLPLDLIEGKVLARDGYNLLCANHAALFNPETGICLSGPCAGKKLATKTIKIKEGKILTT